MPFPTVDSLDALIADYDAILCDVWGVLHNGVTAWPEAFGALRRARRAGRQVVLVTNAPRPHLPVRRQLAGLGVPEDAFDAVVTSGDVTRALIAQAPRRLFHIGTERDLSIFEGLDVELAEEREASAFVCTGLYNDETETPDDYGDLLARLRGRDLSMICANPDIVVDRGGKLIYCAGALARLYQQLGGRTQIAGKPHRPIYDKALELAEQARGSAIDRSRVLAVGDGMTTDVKGAMDAGLDLLFVSDGIHAREYGAPGAPDPERLAAYLTDFGARPVATMTRLA
ncbi:MULTISPECIES: TIGR01459 family HAD-type hydrolase [unclassified Roseitalea]|uniref:TIGR01459 family HAD-type hydrolase n=1 Tax=unclassified Roseitalea TaxID=2639107 RepID=UPI0027402DEA|nr:MULTISPECIES: TIGR01459 family HAD-type hydrolase [unclassified Roseitalea]